MQMIGKSIAIALLIIPLHVEAAVLIAGSEVREVAVGQEVILKVGVDTAAARLNVFNLSVRIPEQVAFVGFKKETSAINIWIQEPKWEEKTRTVSFVGGVPGGVRGRVVLLEIVLKPERVGSYEFKVSPQSEVYLNDGFGTKGENTYEGFTLKVREAVPSGSKQMPIRNILIGLLVIAFIAGIIWRILHTARSRAL